MRAGIIILILFFCKWWGDCINLQSEEKNNVPKEMRNLNDDKIQHTSEHYKEMISKILFLEKFNDRINIQREANSLKEDVVHKAVRASIEKEKEAIGKDLYEVISDQKENLINKVFNKLKEDESGNKEKLDIQTELFLQDR